MNEHSNSDHGYLVLADISGFDAYLAGVELEHAEGVLQELMELIVARLTPPLTLASLEGDAVLAFAPKSQLPRGETLLELTESTYVAFRDRLTNIHRNTTCGCRACLAVPTLDLKFLVHFGEYHSQPEEGRVALGGLDADLVRDRLLKDQVEGGEAAQAYALFTDQSLQQMRVQPEGMAHHSGTYPHLGEVKTASLDLQARYDALTEARQAYVESDEADIVYSRDFDVSPAVLWEWLNDPVKRSRWIQYGKWTVGLRPGGRTDVGARNHCAHGIGTLIETIRDWRPHDYFTVDYEQWSSTLAMATTYQLLPVPENGGTRLEVNTVIGRTPRWMSRRLVKAAFGRLYANRLDRMAKLIAHTA